MTQVKPSDMPSSQAGLATFIGRITPNQATPPFLVDEEHEHVWLPVLTERTSTGQNSFSEHRVYRCLCGKEVK